MKTHTFSCTLLSLCLGLLAGCGGGGDAPLASPQNSTLHLNLTDAPVTGAQKVWISFTGVEVQPADGASKTFTFSSPRGFDLLALQNGNAATLLEDTTVPAGAYQWIRLMVDVPGSYVIDSTGVQRSLTMPSAAESGLKLIRGFTMPVGGRADFTIDFVLAKSVIAPPGQSPNYLFKPVLRLVDNVQVGTLAGTFDTQTIVNNAACAQRAPMVYLFTGGGVTPDDLFTGTPAQGVTVVDALTTATAAYNNVNVYAYKIGFVPTGTYTVAFTCDLDDPEVDETTLTPNPVHFTVYPQPVTITAGQTSTANF